MDICTKTDSTVYICLVYPGIQTVASQQQRSKLMAVGSSRTPKGILEDPGRRKTGSHSYRNQTKTLHIFEGQIQNMHCYPHLSEMRPNPYVHPILTYQYQDKPKPVTPSRVRNDPTTPG